MASYKQAINWMALNDDTDWVLGDPTSVTACMVADLFKKHEDQVRRDLFNELKKSGEIVADAELIYDEECGYSRAA